MAEEGKVSEQTSEFDAAKSFKNLAEQLERFDDQVETAKVKGSVDGLSVSQKETQESIDRIREEIDPSQLELRQRLASEQGYKYIGKFRHGLAIAETESLKVLIDKTGEVVGETFGGAHSDLRISGTDDFLLANGGTIFSLEKREYFNPGWNADHRVKSFRDGIFTDMFRPDFSGNEYLHKKGEPNFYNFCNSNFEIIAEEVEACDTNNGVIRYWLPEDSRGENVYGYLNDKGENIGSYKKAEPFSEDLAAVYDNNGWYFIDKNGDKTMGPYDEVCRPGSVDWVNGNYAREIGFHEGYAFVVDPEGEHILIIDKNGAEQCRYIRDEIEDFMYFSEGMAAIKKKGHWVYIDHKGQPTIQKVFKGVGPFKNGFACVKSKDGAGLVIDSSGNEIYGRGVRYFEWGNPISPDLFEVFDDDQGGHVVINRNGEQVFPKSMDNWTYSENGSVIGYMREEYPDPNSDESTQKWGAFSASGQEILPAEFDDLDISDGVIKTRNWVNSDAGLGHHEYKYFDLRGKPVFISSQESES